MRAKTLGDSYQVSFFALIKSWTAGFKINYPALKVQGFVCRMRMGRE